MDITREMIRARLDGLRGGLEQLKAELQAHLGAIQETEFWLKEAEKAEVANGSISSPDHE